MREIAACSAGSGTWDIGASLVGEEGSDRGLCEHQGPLSGMGLDLETQQGKRDTWSPVAFRSFLEGRTSLCLRSEAQRGPGTSTNLCSWYLAIRSKFPLGVMPQPMLGLSTIFPSSRTKAGSKGPGSGRCWTESFLSPWLEEGLPCDRRPGISSSRIKAFCEREAGPFCTWD